MSKVIIFGTEECVIDVKKYERQVWTFADQICSDQDYMNYMQHQRRADRWKVKQNIIDSKLPECAVNDYLVSKGFPEQPNNPDFRIYDKRTKSWDPDLNYTLAQPWMSDSCQVGIAVKSCTKETADKYGASYVFNIGTDSCPNTIENAVKGAKHSGCDDLFINGTDKDVIAFVMFDRANMTCAIRGFANWKALIKDYQNAFGTMRLPKFRTIKTAIYDSYLQKIHQESQEYGKMNAFLASCGANLA
jgi:hypothetical protein